MLMVPSIQMPRPVPPACHFPRPPPPRLAPPTTCISSTHHCRVVARSVSTVAGARNMALVQSSARDRVGAHAHATRAGVSPGAGIAVIAARVVGL